MAHTVLPVLRHPPAPLRPGAKAGAFPGSWWFLCLAWPRGLSYFTKGTLLLPGICWHRRAGSFASRANVCLCPGEGALLPHRAPLVHTSKCDLRENLSQGFYLQSAFGRAAEGNVLFFLQF